MIYLFRKRNGSIIATQRESASSMFNTPNNFTTFQPEYLGAVSPLDYKQALKEAGESVVVEIKKLVKVNGEDTLIILDSDMIHEAILNKDKAIEAKYQKLLQEKAEAIHAILETLAEKADKTSRPTDYSKKLAAVEEVRGDVGAITKGYINS